MNPSQQTRTLWLAVFAGLMAMFLLYSYTNEKSAQLSKQFGAKQRVVVALEDIQEMQTLRETLLEVVEKPVDFIQPKAVRNPEEVVGFVALTPIRKGEQILANKLSRPGVRTGLSVQITPRKRAITLPVDEVRGVAKLIKPGDRIDILAAIDMGSGLKKRKVVKTLLQNVVVLATGLRVAHQLPLMYERENKGIRVHRLREDTNFSNITVEVSASDSQSLAYILSTSPSALFLTLRHPTDTKINTLSKASQDTILGRPSLNKLKKAASRNISSKNVLTPADVSLPKKQPKKKKRSKKRGFVDL